MDKELNNVQNDNTLPCQEQLNAVHTTLNLLNGKWKIYIIGSLRFGKKRFMELQREVENVGSKMLSKDLRELEINGLVIRTVHNTKPVIIEYELTPYGRTLESIIREMVKWGLEHQKRCFDLQNSNGTIDNPK